MLEVLAITSRTVDSTCSVRRTIQRDLVFSSSVRVVCPENPMPFLNGCCGGAVNLIVSFLKLSRGKGST